MERPDVLPRSKHFRFQVGRSPARVADLPLDDRSVMTFTVTSTHRATGEVVHVGCVPNEQDANHLARLTRLAYYMLEVTVAPLDITAATAWHDGTLPDEYCAKKTDGCFRCQKQLGVTVWPLAGWVCQICHDELQAASEARREKYGRAMLP